MPHLRGLVGGRFSLRRSHGKGVTRTGKIRFVLVQLEKSFSPKGDW